MSIALQTDSEFAVVLLTQDGTIVDAHPTCFDSLGWSREELAGKDIGELLQSDRELLMSQLLQSKDEEPGLDGQTSFSLRILARRRDETTFPARVVVRRFDQNECCTVAFYRVTPHSDSDAPPTVRPEEIQLAMRANGSRPAPAEPKAEKPKSRWRNARLLFGSKPAPQPEPAPAPAPKPSAPLPPPPIAKRTQPIPPVPATVPPNVPPNVPPRPPRPKLKFDPAVPDDIFLSNAPKPAAKPAPAPEPEPEPEAIVELAAAEPQLEAEPVAELPALEPALDEKAEIAVTESRQPIVEEPESTNFSSDETPTYDALARELEQERHERRRLEERASALTSQVSALHRQVGENLDIESRNQKKVTTLEEQVRELRGQLHQLKNDVVSEREKNGAAQKRIDAANAVSTSLNEKLEALQLLHDTLARTQAESEGQLKAVNADLKKAQESLAAETAKRNELEAQLTANKQQQAEQERAFKLEISKLETALKSKDVEIKDLQARDAQAQLQGAN